MANRFVSPNWIIDSADVPNDATLLTLKIAGGGANAFESTDNLYNCEGFRTTLTLTGARSINKIYNGDNPTGTAVTKTGYCTISLASYTLSIYDTTNNGGLSGNAGVTSSYTIYGTSDAVRGGIKSNTVSKVGDGNCPGPNSYRFVNFLNTYILNLQHAGCVCESVDVKTASPYAFGLAAYPTTWTGISVTDIAGGVYCVLINFAITLAQQNAIFANLKLVRTTAETYNTWGFRTLTGTLFMNMRQNAAPWGVCPAWTSSVGAVTLLDNLNLTLQLTFGAATSARGERVRYNLYIRDGAAPDVFGATGAYFLGSANTSPFTIACDASGVVLQGGHTYYVIVRCADAQGNEDTNTTALNVTLNYGVANRLDDIEVLLLAGIH